MATPVISELLCFIQNNVSATAKDLLLSRVIGFFTVDEVVTAKGVLFTTGDNLKASGFSMDMPRCISRRIGEGKKRADAEDIFDLWEKLDVAKADLPLFCAVNLSRLPPLTFCDADASGLAALVVDMKCQLLDVQAKLSGIEKKLESPKGVAPQVPVLPAVLQPALQPAASSQGPSSSAAAPSQAFQPTSWAERFSTSPPNRYTTDADGFTLVVGKKLRQSPIRPVVKGSKVLPADSAIKAAPRRVTVFVGRLDQEATADALQDYLHAAGIENPTCKKLLAKDGRTFRTSAFMVSCDAKFREILFNESSWPAGSEIRDWVFRQKEGSR